MAEGLTPDEPDASGEPTSETPEPTGGLEGGGALEPTAGPPADPGTALEPAGELASPELVVAERPGELVPYQPRLSGLQPEVGRKFVPVTFAERWWGELHPSDR